MIESIQPVVPPLSSGAETASKPTSQAQASQPQGEAASANANTAPTRLYVEQQGGRYIYRIMDVVTGRVLLEVPREQVDDLRGFASSSGAGLVSTTA